MKQEIRLTAYPEKSKMIKTVINDFLIQYLLKFCNNTQNLIRPFIKFFAYIKQ